ncbi:MAG: DUF4238 domain-containing protein [Planctomycetes bacterium]|nr:DUF4238 domain-containing protein [Planctomycetota bacterium]
MTENQRWDEPRFSSTDVKRQHYVPRMLLKPFTSSDGRLQVTDFNESRVFRTSLENAAVESRFNDETIRGIPASTENWLSKIEGKAAPVIRKLIEDPDGILCLSLNEEIALARFVTAMRFRTPSFRAEMNRTFEPVVAQIKKLAKEQLFHMFPDTAAETWAEWSEKPDHQWLQEEHEPEPASVSNSLLGEINGHKNLILAAPWRIGRTAASLKIYIGDSGVSPYLTPVRPWWEGAAFASFAYYLPLSPAVLFVAERRTNYPETSEGSTLEEIRGSRRRADFSKGATSFARHVVTASAHRFVFGDATVVPRDCAYQCLDEIGGWNRRFRRL